MSEHDFTRGGMTQQHNMVGHFGNHTQQITRICPTRDERHRLTCVECRDNCANRGWHFTNQWLDLWVQVQAVADAPDDLLFGEARQRLIERVALRNVVELGCAPHATAAGTAHAGHDVCLDTDVFSR